MSVGEAEPGVVLPRLRSAAWKVLVATLLVTAIHVVLAQRAVRFYRSEAVIGIPGRLSPSRMLAVAMGMPAELDITGARITAVLRSSSLLDATVARFKIMARIPSPEQARELVLASCPAALDTGRRIVRLQCDATEPALAHDMVQFMAEEGSELYRRISRSMASEERAFLESRIASARDEMEQAETQLRATEQKHAVHGLTAQTTAAISALAQLERLRIGRELQLAYQRTFANPGESSVRQLEAQLDAIDKHIREIERDPAASDDGAMLLPVAALPAIASELHVAERTYQIRNAVYEFVLQQHELAKIQEARDTPAYEILDPATMPELPVRPNRTQIILAGVFLGILVGLGWCLLPGWWRSQDWYFRSRSHR